MFAHAPKARSELRHDLRRDLLHCRPGEIKHLWKAAGQYKVIGIFDLPDGDSMDAAVHSLPIWTSGHHEMAQNLQWIPLRDYRNWAEDLKKLGS